MRRLACSRFGIKRFYHNPAYGRFVRLLRRWREEAKLTQRDLAGRLKKPASYVAKSELGERRVDAVEMVRWCRACNVKPMDAMKALDANV